MCICITDSLCCTPETNTTLQINYTPIKFFFKKVNESEHSLQPSPLLSHLEKVMDEWSGLALATRVHQEASLGVGSHTFI